MSWLVESTDLSDEVDKLERCAAASLQWADSNAVRFGTSKTEVVLFFRKRKHRRCDKTIGLDARPSGSMRRLGIWLDSTLSLAEKSTAADREDPARPMPSFA